MVGNKVDMISARVIHTVQHDSFISLHGLQGGFYASAKSGEHVLKGVYITACAVCGVQPSETELEALNTVSNACTHAWVYT